MYNKVQISIIALFVVLVTFSCQEIPKDSSKQSEISENKTEIVKLKWLGQWYGEGKKETMLYEIAREFSLLNQDIEIDLEFPQQMANLQKGEWPFYAVRDTILKMVEHDNWPYDLMICDSYLYLRIGYILNDMQWGQKYLVDFKDESWFIQSHKDYVINDSRHVDKYGGIAPGAFIEGMWNLLYVSSVVEERLGVKVKLHDMNLSDFLSYAKIVYEYNKEHDEKIMFLNFPRKDMKAFLHHLVLSYLEKDEPENIEEAIVALKDVFKELEKFVPYEPLNEYVNYVDTEDKTLYHDQILFIYYPSWGNLFWRQTNPEGEKLMQPCEMPSLDGKKATFYSGNYNVVFVVPKKAKNTDAAKTFMQFLSSSQTAEKWSKYSKSPSGLKSKISYNDFAKDKYSTFSNHISNKYKDRLDEGRVELFLFKVDKEIHFYVEEIMQGRILAEAALENILNQVGIEQN